VRTSMRQRTKKSRRSPGADRTGAAITAAASRRRKSTKSGQTIPTVNNH
jgi:hypothetical protein